MRKNTNTFGVYDVLVAGGGPVGWACALAARVALGKQAKIAVIERLTAPPLESNEPLSPRVYTVSSGNLSWLSDLDVAFDAARLAVVKQVVVHGVDGLEAMRIDERDLGPGAGLTSANALASVIEHEHLASAISDRAQKLGVTLIVGEVGSLHEGSGADAMLELVDGAVLTARVVIAADGAQSKLRAEADIASSTKAYPQHGVVAHFECTPDHLGTAQQWFQEDGSILALLPLPPLFCKKGKTACSMVWSTTPEHADALLLQAEDALMADVSAATKGAVQLRRVISSPKRFPLSLVRTSDPVKGRLVVVGDAAHAMHPLAGQGVNVGLGDARALAEVWSEGAKIGCDAGHALLLAKYRRLRFGPTFAMQFATDSLFRLYNTHFMMPKSTALAVLDSGMRFLSKVPAFRRAVSAVATR